MMIQLFKNKPAPVETHFRVAPRDILSNSITLPLETIKALNKAASILKIASKERYEIVLTRGYINWNLWRHIRGVLAQCIFCLLYWSNRYDAPLLFSSNGHEDGLSVDVTLYDVQEEKYIKFLSWRNVFMHHTKAKDILMANKHLIDMLNAAMNDAGFIVHPDPREKLQMHYRLTRS